MEDCITLAGVIGAILGFITSETAHYFREWFANQRLRRLARVHAKLEIRFQRENAAILLHQYSSARKALGGSEEFDREFPRIVLTFNGLEKAKNQLIETGGEENLIIALHRSIGAVMVVESVRPGAMDKLQDLLGNYSKEHREYREYRANARYLVSLDTALEQAIVTLEEAEKLFQESGW